MLRNESRENSENRPWVGGWRTLRQPTQTLTAAALSRVMVTFMNGCEILEARVKHVGLAVVLLSSAQQAHLWLVLVPDEHSTVVVHAQTIHRAANRMLSAMSSNIQNAFDIVIPSGRSSRFESNG